MRRLFEKKDLNNVIKCFDNLMKEIRRNILRSILTVLGIVIGVASSYCYVMIGDGTTANVTANIEKLGNNMLNVRVGQRKESS